MSDTTPAPESGAAPTREQTMRALFAQMVMQNSNMAAIFLGLAPNPQTGKTEPDLDNARFFIDQLEMLEVKTKGNLDQHEQAFLKQSLAGLRMAYVEAANHPKTPTAPVPAPETKPESSGPATDEQEMPVNEPVLPGEHIPPKAESESAKKFSKKYS